MFVLLVELEEALALGVADRGSINEMHWFNLKRVQPDAQVRH